MATMTKSSSAPMHSHLRIRRMKTRRVSASVFHFTR
jgi:hypothetical protein